MSDYRDKFLLLLFQILEETARVSLEAFEGACEEILVTRAALVEAHLAIDEAYQKNEALEKEIAIDELTGLWTRRLAIKTINTSVRAAYRNNVESIGFIFIDVDDFGLFNKRWGHGIGDFVLKTIGKTLLDNMRPDDAAIRIGGDEILIVAPGKALVLASRIKESLLNFNHTLGAGTLLHQDWTLPQGHEIEHSVLLPSGERIEKGSLLQENTIIPRGSRFPEGIHLQITVSMGITYVPLAAFPQSPSETHPDISIPTVPDFELEDEKSFMGKVIAACNIGLRNAKSHGKARYCKQDFPHIDAPAQPIRQASPSTKLGGDGPPRA